MILFLLTSKDDWSLLKQCSYSCMDRCPSFIWQGYCLSKACESAIPTLFSYPSPLCLEGRGKERKAGSGSYLLHYSGFPLHPRPESACSPSRLSERELVSHQIIWLSQEFHALSEVEECCTQSKLKSRTRPEYIICPSQKAITSRRSKI